MDSSEDRESGVCEDHRMDSRTDYDYSSDDEEDVFYEDTPLLSGKRPSYRSSSVSVQRVRLTWENLRVNARPQKSIFKKTPDTGLRRTQILRNVNGAVESGQLIAIMGASGSGKTTLLNALTARNMRNFSVEGHVRVNGQELGRKITGVSAYVQQDDLFVGTLTVKEHLVFQALLRLPKRFTREQKLIRVNEVMLELGLRKCANTKIGIPGWEKGISGGESKRLAFASEVLRNPPLLFCDEPTTGIDSFMAQSVVRVLQKLACGGKAILCTIHQPTSDVYKMFDRVIFMAEGRIAYAGPTSDALEFFSNQGYRCPDDYNPSDYIIHTLATAPGQEVQCKERIEEICDEFERQRSTSPVEERDGLFLQSDDLGNKSPYNATWTTQFAMLLWRSALFSFRHRRFVFARTGQKTLLGIFLGLLYMNTQVNQSGVTNYNGAMFFMLAEISFPAVFGLLAMLPTEFPLLVREHHNGVYSISSYYLAKVVSLIPTFSVDCIVFISISYFMIGFRPTADGFFTMLGIAVLIAQCACAFGALMASIMPASTPLAVATMTPIETALYLMTGYFANVITIPSYISWVQYFSWFRFGYEAFAINQWYGVENITCETTSSTCLENGEEVLGLLSFSSANFNIDILFLSCILVGFHLLGYLALWRRIFSAR